jgi:hypothetical protein
MAASMVVLFVISVGELVIIVYKERKIKEETQVLL